MRIIPQACALFSSPPTLGASAFMSAPSSMSHPTDEILGGGVAA